ncbi:sulfite exporter TauE/SafE family protein, partial [Acinetobacter baumannii]
MSTATVIGTNKVSSIFGTASAAYTFAKKVKLQWKLLAVIAICALISSFAGAACLSLIPQSVLRPFVFVMLIVIAIYTLVKKNFGQVHTEQKITTKMLVLAGIGSLAIGFYDG